jgi:hypothetical protein
MRAILLILAAAVALPAYGAHGSIPNPVFQADFSNPGSSPQHWTLTLRANGSGHFRSERSNSPATGKQIVDVPNVDRDIQLSTGFTEHVFQAAQRHKWFDMDCESHMKVAFQGWKKLSYSGPDGEGSCMFNFAKDKEIQALGDSLVAVAATILEGERLEMLETYDRLGLDREMEYLQEAVGDGRIQQICAIRGILKRLADDQTVMERVRKRARILLAKAEK